MIFRKKLLILVMIICILINNGLAVFGFSDFKNATFEKVIERVCGLGIMQLNDDGTFAPSENVTRAEMASIICNIFNYNNNNSTDMISNWQKQFFGNGKDEVTLKTPSEIEKNRFSDVVETYWAYDAINFVAEVGLMSGVGSDIFEPDQPITYEQAVKVMIDLMGYKPRTDIFGAYPNGYLKVANELGILNGVSVINNCTRLDVANIINNCFNVELLKCVSVSNVIRYDNVNGETLLTKIMGLNVIKGMISDNGITDLLGKSRIGENKIAIGNKKLKITDDTSYARSFIGRHVECYYRNDNSKNEDDIVYVALTGKDEALTINADDFVSYNNNEMVFCLGNQTISKKIAEGVSVIYNGLALETYSTGMFDFENGNITLINSKSSSEVDIIIVKNYKSWYVSYIDSDDYKIYNELDSNDVLTLDEISSDYYIAIYKEDGSKGNFGDIKLNNVLDVSRNDNIIEIHITNTVISNFKIEEIIQEPDDTYIISGEKKYKISYQYLSSSKNMDIKLGDVINLYLNRENQVVWINIQEDDTIKTAYVTTIGYSGAGLKKYPQIKVFDILGNNIIVDVADKVTFSDLDGNETSFKNDKLIEKMGNYKGLFRYKVNSDKKIQYIELPISDSETKKEKLHLIMETDNSNKDTLGLCRSDYIGGKACLANDIKIIGVNPNKTDDSAYTLFNRNVIRTDDKCIIKLYTTIPGSVMAHYGVYTTDLGAQSISTSDRTVAMVKKITKAIAENGDIAYKISVYNMPSSGVPSDLDLFAIESCLNNINDAIFSGDGKKYTLEAGDIIRYSKNNDGLVDNIKMLWDENGVNPDSLNGAKGHLAGTSGFYSSSELFCRTNPFAFNSETTLYDAYSFNSGLMRVLYGFPYRVKDGVMTVTTQDLTISKYDKNGQNGKYVVENWILYNPIIINLKDRNTVVAKVGTFDDIKTNEDFGPNCSRVIVMTRFSTVDRVIVVNGYFD